MSNCPQYLIYEENGMWRVACTDGRTYKATGLYTSKEQAIQVVEVAGGSYQVVEGRTTYELF